MKKDWRELISQPKYGIKVEKDVYVTMRDGVRLAIDIYRPNARGKFPALLAMSPYGKDEVELLMAPQPLARSAVWDGNIEAGDFNDIVPRGYVHIIGDERGMGHSGGEFPGPDGRDCYDLYLPRYLKAFLPAIRPELIAKAALIPEETSML
jgi:predicted acyl esterase